MVRSLGMRWVRQDPVTEDCCGQCCAAMLLGKTKRDILLQVGHDEGTTTREMMRLLRDGGLTIGPRLRKLRAFADIPTPHALLLGAWRRYPHWMVYDTGRVLDPVEGVLDVRGATLPNWIRVTHYLWVARRA
jgi:hypothetical protein